MKTDAKLYERGQARALKLLADRRGELAKQKGKRP